MEVEPAHLYALSDVVLADLPAQFETTENSIVADEVFADADTPALLDLAGLSSQARTKLERRWPIRQFFLKQDRATSAGQQGNKKLGWILKLFQ
jgi:hypothetical protein